VGSIVTFEISRQEWKETQKSQCLIAEWQKSYESAKAVGAACASTRFGRAPIHLSGSFFHGNQSVSGLRTRTVTMDKTQLKGCLILIVEDYKDTRDAIRLFLEFCGARVLAAATGRDGLDLVSRYHPKVIVSDLSMPQMDGYDLLGHVRELAPEDATPVIALTAHSDAEERQKALKAGFARFLTKPVDPEQLVHEICNVLEPD
jgi:CheY-like chemotaxis protein